MCADQRIVIIVISLLATCGTWEYNLGLQPVHNGLYLLNYLPAP